MTSGSTTVGLRPVPRIDHVMVLLDEQAYDDVAASGFLAQRFGRLKRKEADSSIAGSYATLGVAGRNTLVELFRGSLPGSALVGGLVFSFEEPSSSVAARAALDAAGGVPYHHDLVRRSVDGSDVQQPWYHLISVDLGEASPLLLFLNEVTAQYFRSIGARPAPDGALRRSDYLDAVLGGPDDGTRLMRDITGITLRVRPQRAARIGDALAALGYLDTTEAGQRLLRGPDLTVRLTAEETGPERVAELELDLVPGTRPADVPAELTFGTSSRLVIDGNTARWSFDPRG